MFSAAISRTLAAPSEIEIAWVRMRVARVSRSFAFSAFESSPPAIARRSGGMTMAHATTGPARGPRPTSSTPAISRAPSLRSSLSIELQRGMVSGADAGCRMRNTWPLRGRGIRRRSAAELLGLGRARHRNDDAHFPFLDARGLAGHVAKIEQLRPTHAAAAHDGDLGEHRRVHREDALDAHTVRDLADRERLGDAGAATRDAHALEGLQTLLLTFLDAHVDAQRVAGAEGGNGLHPFLLGLDKRMHFGAARRSWVEPCNLVAFKEIYKGRSRKPEARK